MKCVACGDQAKTLRRGDPKPCCKSCVKLSKFKWESAIAELARIEGKK
jgi:hypothetical protein